MSPIVGNADTWLYSVDKILNPGKDSRWKYGGLEASTLMPLNNQVNIPGRKYEVGEDYSRHCLLMMMRQLNDILSICR